MGLTNRAQVQLTGREYAIFAPHYRLAIGQYHIEKPYCALVSTNCCESHGFYRPKTLAACDSQPGTNASLTFRGATALQETNSSKA